MKHLIKNNQIVQSGIPGTFTRANGEGFWGGYESRADLHFIDGWRDEIIPEYDPKTQYLGGVFYDKALDVCTYTVQNRVINLNSEKQRLYSELTNLRTELSNLIVQAQLAYEVEPVELTQLIVMIRGLNSFVKAEIEALTVDTILTYVLRGEQVNQLINTLKSFV